MSHWMVVFPALSYALFCVLMFLSSLRHKVARKTALKTLPKVSVLVSARNESKDLPRCLDAIAALNYPPEKLQVVVIDDRSTDDTLSIAKNFAKRFAHFEVHSTKDFKTHLQHKARGIALGAKHAEGLWLFICDADAAVHPDWIRCLLAEATPKTGILAGAFVLEHGPGLLQNIETAVVGGAQGFCVAMQTLGGESTPSGPNMAIRTDVYRSEGGLEAVDFRVAEDMALWRLVKRAGLRAQYVSSAAATVTTTAVSSWMHFISQNRRWIGGAVRDAPAVVRWSTLGVGAWALVTTLSIFTAFILGWETGLVALGGKLLGDFLAVTTLARWTERPALIWRAPLLTLYTAFMYTYIPISLVLKPGLYWRGDDFETRCV